MKKSDSACRDIRAASTESQVVAAVRAYLASLDPAEVALVPTEIMAFNLSGAEEAVQAALHLVHAQMLGMRDATQYAMLSEVVLVFSTAARRLAVLAKDTT